MKRYTYILGFLVLNLYVTNVRAVVLNVTNNAPMRIAAVPIYSYVAPPSLLFTVPSTQRPAGFTGNYIVTPGQVTTGQNLQEVFFVDASFLPQVGKYLENMLTANAKGGLSVPVLQDWSWGLQGFMAANSNIPYAFYKLTPDEVARVKSIDFTVGYTTTTPLPASVTLPNGQTATPEQMALLSTWRNPMLTVTVTNRTY